MSFVKYLLDFIPALGQLKFPSTQNPGSNAFILDDYRSNQAWTPALIGSGGGSATYSLQVGSYIKIGRLVIASFEIVLSSINTLNGSLSLGTLPYAASVSQVNHYMTTLAFNNITGYLASQQFDQIIMYVQAGNNTCLISGNKVNQADSSNTARVLQDFDITNTTQFLGTLVYFTDN